MSKCSSDTNWTKTSSSDEFPFPIYNLSSLCVKNHKIQQTYINVGGNKISKISLDYQIMKEIYVNKPDSSHDVSDVGEICCFCVTYVYIIIGSQKGFLVFFDFDLNKVKQIQVASSYILSICFCQESKFIFTTTLNDGVFALQNENENPRQILPIHNDVLIQML